jgi:hypothetical protein
MRPALPSILFALSLCTVAAVASVGSPSAVRLDGETFSQARRRNAPAREIERDSASDSAVPLEDIDWSSVPVLSSDLVATFRVMRDWRVFLEPSVPDFPRRIPWLYPRDGCYARAGALVRVADKLGIERPAQFFAFGELVARTDNVPEGEVRWWYHVAAVYRDRPAGDVWVFDPALEPRKPIPVVEWLSRMAPSPADVRVALCGALAAEPWADCRDGDASATDKLVAVLESQFLPWEWTNLVGLGRDPHRELGDEPPWLADESALSSDVTSPIDRTARKASWTVMSRGTSFSSSTRR